MSLDFVKMIPNLYKRRYLKQMQYLISSKVPCGFFCGSYISENIVDLVDEMQNSGINFICIFVLSEEDKDVIGDIGLPVLTLKELSNLDIKVSQILYIGSFLESAFFSYFQRFGIDILPISNSDITEAMFHFYIEHLPELYSVHEMFSDEESKEVFRSYITGKLTKRLSDFKFAPEAQYFLEGFFPVEGDVVIDGGAYDGATSRDFAQQGAKVYAFEMSAENYPKCIDRAEKYNFVIENLGLSNREGEECYIESNTSSRKGEGTSVAHFIDLDTYVIRKNIPRVDYIKLDIEGSEWGMLHGAAKTISRWKPKMAISAYHTWEDLWTLASYIKSLRSDYEFKFRHYKVDCTDYTLNDTERSVLQKFGLDYFVPSADEAVLYCR